MKTDLAMGQFCIVLYSEDGKGNMFFWIMQKRDAVIKYWENKFNITTKKCIQSILKDLLQSWHFAILLWFIRSCVLFFFKILGFFCQYLQWYKKIHLLAVIAFFWIDTKRVHSRSAIMLKKRLTSYPFQKRWKLQWLIIKRRGLALPQCCLLFRGILLEAFCFCESLCQ